jgi:hypothetical protein
MQFCCFWVHAISLFWVHAISRFLGPHVNVFYGSTHCLRFGSMPVRCVGSTRCLRFWVRTLAVVSVPHFNVLWLHTLLGFWGLCLCLFGAECLKQIITSLSTPVSELVAANLVERMLAGPFLGFMKKYQARH